LLNHCHDGTPLENRNDLYRIIERLSLTKSSGLRIGAKI